MSFDVAAGSLVMVPGLGLDQRAWQPTIEALGGADPRGAEVMLLPAYGMPGSRQERLDPVALGQRLASLLPPGRRVVLAGHSASCQVVVHAALQGPSSVAGLVLVGPTTDPRASTWPRLAARWLATARHERVGQVPPLVRQYRRTTLRTMARGMDAARRDRIGKAMSRLPCPVLLVRGRHDRIAPADWLTSLAGTGAETRAVTLPAGAHMVPLTHGDLLAAEIVRFLSGLDD
jgi:pimeloyl-ACP methyl ester carboxylesterase